MSRPRQPNQRRVRQRTKELRGAIDGMDYLASGTLHTRTKVCGRKNCRCADDPAARHGPYHEWTRRQQGRLVHSVITTEQAQLIARALANYREVKTLLALWERETAAEILSRPPAPTGG